MRRPKVPYESSRSPRRMRLRQRTFARARKLKGLSFGDRACLALAARFEVPAVTADREWRSLPEVGVAVKLIR